MTEDRDPTAVAQGTATTGAGSADATGPRPLVERLGLAAVAVLLAAVFTFVGFAAWTSGEVFLSVMAGIGALMTVWAAVSTLRRG